MNVERVVTSGVFALDGQEWEVDNNVWIVGGDAAQDGVVIVDAAHDAGPIAAAVNGRRVAAIVLTHGHNDHINAAPALAAAVGGPPIYLHPDDLMLWHQVFPGANPDRWLEGGLEVGGLTVLHTPGHSPGGCCLFDGRAGGGAAGAATLFSGDTLFRGGPGNTSRSFSSFPTIIESIQATLLRLPAGTVVHPGHGDDTTIGDEAPHLDEWVARGY